MPKKLCFLLPLILVGCGGSGSGDTAVTLAKQVIASGLSQPMQYKAVPGQPTLAYVVERGGLIKVLVNDVVQSTPLLNLSALLSTAGEGGVLGIAFDPDFTTNRYIYAHFSSGTDVDTTIVRYTVDSSFLTASISSSAPIFKTNQAPYGNHKGGSINFGSDNMLYVALGDGGSSNDPLNRSQDKTTLLGKMLRINPTGDAYPTDPDNNYSIPAGNPFLGDSTVRPEIWSFGLRNPFRWSFDSVLGGFLISDVGQDSYEEVSYVAIVNGGRNFGWRVREGKHAISNSGPTFGTAFTDPFIDYPRSAGRSITGGFVYRGTALPELTGRYFVADFVTNKFWAVPITVVGGEATSITMPSATSITGGLNGTVSIDPDANGEAIVTELSAGRVSRLIPVATP
jgi:glucose/arabinose dehydrogenase